MSSNDNSEAPYYFVPFGRERGGYLEVLGLTATASDGDVQKKIAEQRKQIIQDFQTRRKE